MSIAQKAAYMRGREITVALPLERFCKTWEDCRLWKSLSEDDFMTQYGVDVLALYDIPSAIELERAAAEDWDDDEDDEDDGEDGDGDDGDDQGGDSGDAGGQDTKTNAGGQVPNTNTGGQVSDTNTGGQAPDTHTGGQKQTEADPDDPMTGGLAPLTKEKGKAVDPKEKAPRKSKRVKTNYTEEAELRREANRRFQVSLLARQRREAEHASAAPPPPAPQIPAAQTITTGPPPIIKVESDDEENERALRTPPARVSELMEIEPPLHSQRQMSHQASVQTLSHSATPRPSPHSQRNISQVRSLAPSPHPQQTVNHFASPMVMQTQSALQTRMSQPLPTFGQSTSWVPQHTPQPQMHPPQPQSRMHTPRLQMHTPQDQPQTRTPQPELPELMEIEPPQPPQPQPSILGMQSAQSQNFGMRERPQLAPYIQSGGVAQSQQSDQANRQIKKEAIDLTLRGDTNDDMDDDL